MKKPTRFRRVPIYRNSVCSHLTVALLLTQPLLAAGRTDLPSSSISRGDRDHGCEITPLRAGETTVAPFGIVSWSSLDVKAGQRAAVGPIDPAGNLPEGTWRIDLAVPTGKDVNRHGLVIDLKPGMQARPGTTPGSVVLEGPGVGRPVWLQTVLRTATGEERPSLALAMGDRVYVELFEATVSETTAQIEFVLRQARARHGEAVDRAVRSTSIGLPCGDGAPCWGFVQVSASDSHTLALTSTGEVRAWGDNHSGKLGDGTTVVKPLPVVVQSVGGGGPLTGIVQVAAGQRHSLALTSSGEVRAWGQGPLGDGSAAASSLPVVVQRVSGGGPLTGVVQVSAGSYYSLATTAAGQVCAWGNNWAGTLGDGTTIDRLLPVLVQAVGGGGPLANIASVVAGGYHSLALTTSGEVRAWGENRLGQLGDGTTIDSSLPVIVQTVGGGGPLTDIAEVVANGIDRGGNDIESYSMALTRSGEVRAWGDGPTGDGTSTNSSLPVVVQTVGGGSPLTDIVHIAAGGFHRVAVTSGGEVRAWGENYDGQIGDGTDNDSALPVVVRSASGVGVLMDIAHVAAAQNFSLALTRSGEIWAWGANRFGQLSGGTATANPLPTCVVASAVEPLPTFVQVAAGGNHTLAVTSTGEVRAWGSGQLGNGTTTSSSVPVVVQAVGGGGPLTGILQVAAGGGHSLALTMGGEVRAWGDNTSGQLGDGTTTDQLLPVVVQAVGGGGPLTDIAQVTASKMSSSGSHSLALTALGEVRAWGGNTSGQLGDGTTASSPLPVVVQAVGGGGPLTGIAEVAAGLDSHFGAFSIALTVAGEVRAWGSNNSGQLGDGTNLPRSLPVVVQAVGGGAPLAGIASIAAGEGFSLALTNGSELRAWGNNDWGQLGDGTWIQRFLPVIVQAVGGGGPLTGIVAVDAGAYHSLALTMGGEVRAWGANGIGRLGNGSVDGGDQLLPEVVLDRSGVGPLTGIIQVAAGHDHSVALTIGGEIHAWGYSGSGQLGDGFFEQSPLPVAAKCRTCAPIVNRLLATRNGNDISLTWETAGSVGSYNVWYVTAKTDIGMARLGSPPAVGVVGCFDPTPVAGLSCLDQAAVNRDLGVVYHYQVRVSCSAGIEGP